MTAAPETWKQGLSVDGAHALRELLSGKAALGRLSAAEPEDAAAAIVGGAKSDPDLIEAFDAACLEVLDSYRRELLRMEGNAFVVGLNRLDKLVSIIRRLLPKQTVLDFHHRFALWNGFFDNFVIDRSLDLRREFFRILALSQDIAESAGIAPRRLMPLWLSICAESGPVGLYDHSYLRVGLLGLRRLPLGEDFSSNEDFALHGLARWAAWQTPTKSEFMREWRVLEGDFPRDAGFWTERVQEAVNAAERELSERTRGETKTFPAAGWWREDVDIVADDRTPVGAGATEPPPREAHERILREIGTSFSALAPRIDLLMQGHRRYADTTGDVFYLVRTACNIGMRLIEKGDKSERKARGAQAVALAKLAFAYDPRNVFAWSLMRNALVNAGRVADAELVGWEAIRRLPEYEEQRTQLATVLARDLGKPEEAAELLKDTIGLFPANAFVRTQLATILAVDLGKPMEAADLLQQAMKRFPDNPYVRTQLATVLADDLNDRAQALSVLKAAIADRVANNVTHDLLGKLERQRKLRGRKPKVELQPDESSLRLPSAEARRLLFRFEAGLADREAVRAFLAESEADSYVTYMAERTGASELPVKTTFALAFDEALRSAAPSKLRGMIATARPVEKSLVEQAIAVSEGGVVPFSELAAETANSERLQKLGEVFAQGGDGAPNRLNTLLRDVSASSLSVSTAFLAAA